MKKTNSFISRMVAKRKTTRSQSNVIQSPTPELRNEQFQSWATTSIANLSTQGQLTTVKDRKKKFLSSSPSKKRAPERNSIIILNNESPVRNRLATFKKIEEANKQVTANKKKKKRKKGKSDKSKKKSSGSINTRKKKGSKKKGSKTKGSKKKGSKTIVVVRGDDKDSELYEAPPSRPPPGRPKIVIQVQQESEESLSVQEVVLSDVPKEASKSATEETDPNVELDVDSSRSEEEKNDPKGEIIQEQDNSPMEEVDEGMEGSSPGEAQIRSEDTVGDQENTPVDNELDVLKEDSDPEGDTAETVAHPDEDRVTVKETNVDDQVDPDSVREDTVDDQIDTDDRDPEGDTAQTVAHPDEDDATVKEANVDDQVDADSIQEDTVDVDKQAIPGEQANTGVDSEDEGMEDLHQDGSETEKDTVLEVDDEMNDQRADETIEPVAIGTLDDEGLNTNPNEDDEADFMTDTLEDNDFYEELDDGLDPIPGDGEEYDDSLEPLSDAFGYTSENGEENAEPTEYDDDDSQPLQTPLGIADDSIGLDTTTESYDVEEEEEEVIPLDQCLEKMKNDKHSSNFDVLVALRKLTKWFTEILDIKTKVEEGTLEISQDETFSFSLDDEWFDYEIGSVAGAIELLQFAGFRPRELPSGEWRLLAFISDITMEHLSNILSSIDNAMIPIEDEFAKGSKSYEQKTQYNRGADLAELRELFTPSHRFNLGLADRKGRRRFMEDSVMISGNFRGNSNEDYFGLFDGHGGSDASFYVSRKLHKEIIKQMKMMHKNKPGTDLDDDTVQELLASACLNVNNAMTKVGVEANTKVKGIRMKTARKKLCKKRKKIKGGTCVVIGIFFGLKLYVANLGDSRAVLCKRSKGVRLSIDHCPEREEERKRIEACGGRILELPNGGFKVNGKLSVARCMGDNHDPYIAPYLSREPSFTAVDLEKEGDDCEGELFLILACDGVWDVITDDEAAEVVYNEIMDGGGTAGSAAQKLVALSYERGSTDNISALVVDIASYFA